MGEMILLEGPVGAGKSSHAAKLMEHRRIPHLNLDDWFVTLYSPDRPAEGLMAWYAERKRRCTEQIWKVAGAVVASGADVILEIGLLTRAERATFYQRADEAGVELTVTVVMAPREVRRERVRQRNRERGATFRMEVPEAFFELANDRWEDPDALEIEERRIEVVNTWHRSVA